MMMMMMMMAMMMVMVMMMVMMIVGSIGKSVLFGEYDLEDQEGVGKRV